MEFDDLSSEATKYFYQIATNYFVSTFSLSYADAGEQLKTCFESISRIYKRRLGSLDPRPDWSDDQYRSTFMYRFFTMHCYMVYHSLQESLDELKRMWKYKFTFRACCIGGGPGSDAVGLMKFLRDAKLLPMFRLYCSVIDLYPEWESNWEMLRKANPDENLPTLSYFSGDLTRTDSGLTPGELSAVRSADIITFVKFFSTVVAFIRADDSKGNLLEEIFKEMKSGAVVLYIDNMYCSQHEEFKTLASAGGVTETLFEKSRVLNQPYVEKSDSIRLIRDDTGFEPLSSCVVSIVVLKKP